MVVGGLSFMYLATCETSFVRKSRSCGVRRCALGMPSALLCCARSLFNVCSDFIAALDAVACRLQTMPQSGRITRISTRGACTTGFTCGNPC